MQNNNYNKLLICGCDETGRGSLAFEVYAAACILDPCWPIEGLADSKKLSPRKREFLAEEIKNYALAWCLGSATLEEIELLNIHNASLLAMKRAIEGLAINPDKVLVDGLHVPDIRFDAEAIVKGDDKIPAISAASILAKVARDKEMVRYHALYPQYGFNHHKGYFTKEHADALRLHGPCPIHRKGYAPVKELLKENTYEQSVMFTDCSEDNRHR